MTTKAQRAHAAELDRSRRSIATQRYAFLLTSLAGVSFATAVRAWCAANDAPEPLQAVYVQASLDAELSRQRARLRAAGSVARQLTP